MLIATLLSNRPDPRNSTDGSLKIDSYHLESRFAKLIDGRWKREDRKAVRQSEEQTKNKRRKRRYHLNKSAAHEAKWNAVDELESVQNLAKDDPISEMHTTKNAFNEIDAAVQPDEELAYFDAVELIYEPRANRRVSSTIRVHIKDETVLTFRHRENELIGRFKLSEFFPHPRPGVPVDAMFFFDGHLNLLSGNRIYSYLYDWRFGRFTKFKNLNFKFRLPPHVEAAFRFGDRLFFTKENQLYVFSLTEVGRNELRRLPEQNRSIEGASTREMQINLSKFTTPETRATETRATETKTANPRAYSGPFRIVGEFLTNCSTESDGSSRTNDDRSHLPSHLPVAGEQFVQSFGRQNRVPRRPDEATKKTNSNDQIHIMYVVLTGLFIIFLVLLLISVFLYLEFYSERSRNFFAGSIKQKRVGIVLKAHSKSSISSKELDKMLEKTRMRCTGADGEPLKNETFDGNAVTSDAANSDSTDPNTKDDQKIDCDGFQIDCKEIRQGSPTGRRGSSPNFQHKSSLTAGRMGSFIEFHHKSSPTGPHKSSPSGDRKGSPTTGHHSGSPTFHQNGSPTNDRRGSLIDHHKSSPTVDRKGSLTGYHRGSPTDHRRGSSTDYRRGSYTDHRRSSSTGNLEAIDFRTRQFALQCKLKSELKIDYRDSLKSSPKGSLKSSPRNSLKSLKSSPRNSLKSLRDLKSLKSIRDRLKESHKSSLRDSFRESPKSSLQDSLIDSPKESLRRFSVKS